MTTCFVWSPVAGKDPADSLRTDAAEMLRTAEGDLILEFSSMCRIGSGELRALGGLADLAEQRGVKVRLRNVNASVYKTLILLKLARRFTFVS